MFPLTQAVILAAGASTRTHPLTIRRPKPLLPLLNKPLLQHTLEQLDGLVEEIILVVGFEREQIRRAFGERFHNIKLTYCAQEQQLGTGHALQQARPLVRGGFFLLNGDDLVHRRDLQRLAAYPYAVLGELVPDPRPFGVLELDADEYLTRIIEKPAAYTGKPLVNTGMFIFQPEIFAALDALGESARGEYELTDVIQHLPHGARCKVTQVSEYWLPVGYPWKLLEANHFLLERAGAASPSLPGVKVEGPVLIGPRTTVEADCYLGPGTTLGANCRVAAGTSLINCLVMDSAQIGPDCRLQDTILADGVTIGADVRTLTRPAAGGTVLSTIKGQPLDTGRASLGAMIGRKVEIEGGCQLYPGVKIWPGLKVAASSVVRSDLH